MFRRKLTECELKQINDKYIKAISDVADEMYRANEIKEEELSVKNRVDISLKEYMDLVNLCDRLTAQVNNYERIFDRFKIPTDVKILHGSVEFEHMDNICDLRRTYCLRFDVNLHEARRLGL